MRVGSLFSGIGGLDHGLHRAGFRHAFFCESDPWRRRVLRERFPGVPIYEDVRAIQPSREGWWFEPGGGLGLPGLSSSIVRGQQPLIHLLCGGFPCQDLSVAGRRAGLEAGERSSLFFEFARVADELVPAGGWILIENVPGLLSSQQGRDFAIVLATLAELGFHDLAWRVLDSRYFGVPQRRRRVFVVARRASGRRAFEVLLEPESGGGDFAAGGEAGAGVAVASLSGLGSGGPDDNDGQAGRVIAVADTLTSGSHPGSNMPGRRREDDTNIVVASETGSGWWREGEARLRSQGGGTPQNVAYVNALKASAGRQNGDPSGDHTRAVLDGAAVRRLTPIECLRLQGLPDDWFDGVSPCPDSRMYAGLGDAVTSPVAEWIGRRIMGVGAAGTLPERAA